MTQFQRQDCLRFAPSPSGSLHLGHAHSALFTWQEAKRRKGRFLLRIEDIDTARCRPRYTEGILKDLAWLGLTWEEPLRHQSRHMADYRKAISILKAQDLLYPCFCTRKEINDEIARSAQAPHGPEAPPTRANAATSARANKKNA